MRYFRLIFTFMKAAFQNESAYRLNFVMNLLSAVLSLAGGIGGIYILYVNNEALNGWTMPETLAVLGVYMLVQAVKNVVIGPSMNKLGGMDGEIESGTFDYTLLKPISTQYYISVREWSLWSILHITVAAGVILFAVDGMNSEITVMAAVQFLVALAISLGILYSVMLILSSIAFWYRGTYMLWIMEDILQAGRYPIGIYPGPLRLVLTWVLPIGFIVSVPAEALVQKADPLMLAAGAVLMIVLFTVATIFFNRSLHKYSSASS